MKDKTCRLSKPISLLFDLETMPNVVRTWRKWEQDVIWYERYGYIWSISWKYLGKNKVYHKNITDFPLYKKDKYSDKELIEFIWKLIDGSDILIAHNGNAFDIKAIYGRFIHYGMKPPTPCKKIDTKLLYKMYLNEDSNSLKDICLKHDLPHKLETGGAELWRLCELGDKKSIDKMRVYNNGDVVALEAAYKLVLPYITNHPNIALMNGDRIACPNCGSKNVHKRGYSLSRASQSQRWRCMDCGAWSSSPLKEGSQIR